jgi:ABC-type phosphate/phosphonate transport system substrate-binding protein
MSLRNPVSRLLLLLSLSLLFNATLSAAELKLGVLAPRGELKAKARWSEFAGYLSQAIGQPVKLVTLPPPRVIDAARNGQIDVLLSHSPHTVYMQEKLGARVLATLNSRAGPRFGGVIVALKGQGIRQAEDLRGKNVMSLKFKAAAGAYIFQTYHLSQKKIDPHRDFASMRQGKKQDDLVLAVQNGLIDAAFVRTGLLEAMARENKIKLADFEVVDRQPPGDFKLLRTTALYPEWCFSVVRELPAETGAAIQQALKGLGPDMPAAKTARIRGFVDPLPLDGIKAALRALKIRPYDI